MILAGVRVATVSTIALVTVGAVVSNGGLGQLIFEGFNNNFYRAEILTATLLCVLLAAVAGRRRCSLRSGRSRPGRGDGGERRATRSRG